MEWYYWLILFFVTMGICGYYISKWRSKRLLTKLFKSYGIDTDNLTDHSDTSSQTLTGTPLALVRVNITSSGKEYEAMASVVSSLTEAGYDIESFLSNILLVPVHNDFQSLAKALSSQISDNSVSIVTSNINSYVGVYGNSKRKHYGHLSADMDKLLKTILSIEYGNIKNIA